MSGPIVRKYGFPNHEQIFGKRPLEHGAEPDAPNADAAPKSEKPDDKAAGKSQDKDKAKAKKKKQS